MLDDLVRELELLEKPEDALGARVVERVEDCAAEVVSLGSFRCALGKYLWKVPWWVRRGGLILGRVCRWRTCPPYPNEGQGRSRESLLPSRGDRKLCSSDDLTLGHACDLRESDRQSHGSTTMPTALSLPCETLVRIADQVWFHGDRSNPEPSLAAMSLTCRSFRFPAQAALFRRQKFLSLVGVRDKASFFERTPRLAVAVREVDLYMVRESDTAVWFADVALLLDATPGVVDLMFFGPGPKTTCSAEGNKMPKAFWSAVRRLRLVDFGGFGLVWSDVCDGLAGCGPLFGAMIEAYGAGIPPGDEHDSTDLRALTFIARVDVVGSNFPPPSFFSSFDGIRFLHVPEVTAEQVTSSGARCTAAFAALVGLQAPYGFDRRVCELVPQIRYLSLPGSAFSALTNADLQVLSRLEILNIDWFLIQEDMDWPNQDRLDQLEKLSLEGSLHTVVFSSEEEADPDDMDDVHDTLSYVTVMWLSEPPRLVDAELMLEGRDPF